MKKILLLIIIFMLTGCKEYNELNDLAIIKSIGIESKKEYTLYAEIIEEIDKDNNPHTKVIETNGNNIEDIFNNIKTLVNKEIYLSHIDLLILDKSLNDVDYKNIANYFLNHKEFRNDFLTIFSSDTKKILEESKYDEIENLITTNKDNKEIIEVSFEEVISKFLDNKDFILSMINYDKEIKFNGNYKYKNNKLERINNEKN